MKMIYFFLMVSFSITSRADIANIDSAKNKVRNFKLQVFELRDQFKKRFPHDTITFEFQSLAGISKDLFIELNKTPLDKVKMKSTFEVFKQQYFSTRLQIHSSEFLLRQNRPKLDREYVEFLKLWTRASDLFVEVKDEFRPPRPQVVVGSKHYYGSSGSRMSKAERRGHGVCAADQALNCRVTLRGGRRYSGSDNAGSATPTGLVFKYWAQLTGEKEFKGMNGRKLLEQCKAEALFNCHFSR